MTVRSARRAGRPVVAAVLDGICPYVEAAKGVLRGRRPGQPILASVGAWVGQILIMKSRVCRVQAFDVEGTDRSGQAG
jgi:hypothetical protein